MSVHAAQVGRLAQEPDVILASQARRMLLVSNAPL